MKDKTQQEIKERIEEIKQVQAEMDEVQSKLDELLLWVASLLDTNIQA